EFVAEAKNRAVKMTSVEECFVMGSERLLRSAIENVLRNAVRYTKMGTTVEVSLRNGGGKASVVIRDYGDGVPQSELKNLFRPFYRVSESRDRGSGGTGLGLAIAEQAIRLHRGTIEARNEPAGLAVEIKLNCTN
ncbi:MAG: two-component sensor histidine kinase, partial [Blastocatellia bacterium]